MNKIQRSLCDLQHLMDDDYKNLSDKCYRLELSHNRMRNLLKMSLDYIESLSFIESDNGNFEYLHKRLTEELYGLENYKGLKGGKKCV